MEEKVQYPHGLRPDDSIWRRVAPGLEPYPGSAAAAMAPVPAPPAPPAVPAPPAPPVSSLPGAVENPCCMGSAAAEMLQVLTGILEEALESQRIYQAMASQAPSWARQTIRELAARKESQARRLGAVYYLITGTCYRPLIPCQRVSVGKWCQALRERYHEEACSGMNNLRASESTTDECLRRVLEELGAEDYRHAEMVMGLLERSLRG